MSEMSDQLLQAQFRGVPFWIDRAAMTAGRRTVIHEYPLRDKPFVEDLGRATRTITLTAFVVGRDYVEQATKLLAAVEEPGSGQLVHPWLGEMTVTATAASTLTFDDRLGYAAITLTFTESGDLEFPSISRDTKAASRQAADAVQQSAIEKFCDSIDVSAVSDYVKAAMQGDLLDVLDVVSSSDLAAVFDKAGEITDLAQDGLSLLSSDPRVFANNLMGALGLSRAATTVAGWSGIARQVKNLFGREELSSSTNRLAEINASGETVSETQRKVIENRAALETLTRQALIVQAIGVSTLVGTTVDAVLPGAMPSVQDSVSGQNEQFGQPVSSTSYDEMLDVRDELLEAIDEEVLRTTTDEEFRVLTDAHSAVFTDMTDRAEQQSRLLSVELPEVMPALVLAYDYYDDANRDLEIVARNSVENGGFCPVDLRISSE